MPDLTSPKNSTSSRWKPPLLEKSGQQIVRQRPRERYSFQLENNGARFERTYGNYEAPIRFAILENDNWLVVFH